MQRRELYLNGELAALGDDDIQIVRQVNSLGDLNSLQNDYTKSFKLPLTQRNRALLGYPDDITITTNQPYEQGKAKLIVDGIEVIPDGILEILDVQDGDADVTILSGNCDFLDLLGGQVYDMGDSTTPWSGYGQKLVWAPYDHIWNVENAAYSQQKTDGWIWPVVNYGDINIIPPFTGYINIRNQRPGFFLHTAIELLVKSTGYTIDYQKSSLVKDPLYQKLIIQFDNGSFDHGSDYQNTPDNLGVTLTKGTNQIISNPRVPINTSQDIYQNQYPFEGVISFGPTDYYAVTKSLNFTATVQFDIFIRGKYTGTPSEVVIKFVMVDVDGTLVEFSSISITMDANYTRLSGDGSGIIGEETFTRQKLSQDFELVAGQKLYVKYHINNIGLDYGSTYAIIYHGASFTVVTNEQQVLWGTPIQCERILPDVSQLDLLKDTLQRFGQLLIADPNTGTIIFISFRDIVANIPNAKDWSDKMVNNGRQNTFKIGDYSQVNWLRYQYDDSIPLNYMPKYFADDYITIPDKTLNPTVPASDLFTSIFGPSLNSPYIGGTIAQISDPTSTDEFGVGSQPRILVDQKLYIGNKGPGGAALTINFTDNDLGFETVKVPINDWLSVPYFYKPDGVYNLCFCDKGGQPGLKSKYYPEFINILQQTKQVTRYFMLTPRDIYELDFSIPIYIRQLGGYFYITQVDSWVKGVPCKVNLVRL